MSETPDQAATRRRWITLAEVVAVSGVIIGALTLWLSWSDRREGAREKAVASAAAAAAEARFALRAVVDGEEVRLSDPIHELLETSVVFPASLGIEPKRPATPRVERDWFASAVLKATDGGSDAREGRLPVLVTASYRVGTAARQGRAIVDIVWRTNGRIVGGRYLKVVAARVREPGGSARRIDALWTTELVSGR